MEKKGEREMAKGMERFRKSKTLQVLVSGSAVAIASNGALIQTAAADDVAPESVTVDVEGAPVAVDVRDFDARDSMDRAAGGVHARGADHTNRSDSHDQSGKDKGDSKGQSAAHTGQNEGNSANGGGGGDQTNKTDSHDQSGKDQGDSKGQSATHTGANEGDSAAPGQTATGGGDSNDCSAKDSASSVGASGPGIDTVVDSTLETTE